jgi:rubrerythrin
MDQRLVIRDGPVDTAVIAEYEAGRRELVRRGLVAGGAVLAAAAVPVLLRARNAFAQADSDQQLLESAVSLEQAAVFTYERGLEQGGLTGRMRAIARLFAGHEREHAGTLTRALADLGGRAPDPPTSVADVDEIREGLRDARGAQAFADFAAELESAAIAAYHDAAGRWSDATLLQTATTIMANEGQHLFVLRQVLGRDPIPNAFETGEGG